MKLFRGAAVAVMLVPCLPLSYLRVGTIVILLLAPLGLEAASLIDSFVVLFVLHHLVVCPGVVFVCAGRLIAKAFVLAFVPLAVAAVRDLVAIDFVFVVPADVGHSTFAVVVVLYLSWLLGYCSEMTCYQPACHSDSRSQSQSVAVVQQHVAMKAETPDLQF